MNNSISLSIGKDNSLVDISLNGEHQYITFEMLKQIWSDVSCGTVEDIEYFHTEVSVNYVICCAYVAQGQGGIVFIWDIDTKKIVHYSDGKFALTAAINDNKVYVLRDVHYWGVTSHLELDYCDFGTMSENNEVTKVFIDDSTLIGNSDTIAEYEIEFVDNTPNIKVKSKKKLYRLIGKNGKPYLSDTKGTLGGHSGTKIYGRLDCRSANQYIQKGQYVKHRVFFADEETAISAGYRPCAVCMKEKYLQWKKNNS